MRYVLGVSGKDSLATTLVLKASQPELFEATELFSVLTGADYPETLKWLDNLPRLLGKKIHLIDGDLPQILESKKRGDSYFLSSRRISYRGKM